jgi:phthalate 4,5-cis-dihydrodiol dehydrogenase
MATESDVIRVGIAGLGRAARQRLPAFKQIPDASLTAVADVRPEALDEFHECYGVATCTSVEAMCKYGEIDAVCVCTPNMLHAEHTIMAAEYGKHVTCEKPMAVTLEQCQAMIDAVERNHVKYAQGHSKIYTLPVRKMREIVSSGQLGRLTQINTWYYNDCLHRGRIASEVDSSIGGG